MKRLRELDFLRGIAILLVLLRHQPFSHFTKNIGWIGVDLFFVLSGFLVSGLLFKEYIRYGKINPGRFLIRRGFKIYPIYYLSYPLYLVVKAAPLSFPDILSDLLFVQNYTRGWGYAYVASWSLAVEEHFYFALTFLLFFIMRPAGTNTIAAAERIKKLPTILFTLIIVCALGRVASNIFLHDNVRNFTMTHVRIDSLLTGVLISFFFHFKKEQLTTIFQSNRYVLYIIAFIGLAWTPFADPIPSFWVKTAGFSALAIAFGIVLLHVILTPAINEQLDRYFSGVAVNIIATIGYCSYSIYVIHSLVNKCYEKYELFENNILSFFVTSVISILLGMFMTYKIEKMFLNLRDKRFPGRTA